MAAISLAGRSTAHRLDRYVALAKQASLTPPGPLPVQVCCAWPCQLGRLGQRLLGPVFLLLGGVLLLTLWLVPLGLPLALLGMA